MATKSNVQRSRENRERLKVSKTKVSTNERENSDARTLSNIERSRKYRLKNSIGFDTFESDLTSLGDSLNGIYNGWQTAETMNNTRASVESMYGRLGAYEDYRKQYGNENLPDLSELHGAYKSALDGWDSQTALYGQYTNADAFNTAKSLRENVSSMTSADIEPFLKDKNNPIAYTTATGENITWEKLYNEKKRAEVIKDVTSREDFEKFRLIGENAENPEFWDVQSANMGVTGWFKKDLDIPNIAKYSRDNRDELLEAMADRSAVAGGMHDFYNHMTDEEYAVYNYLLGQDLSAPEGTKSNKAKEYAKSIWDELEARANNEVINATAKIAEDLPISSSAASVLLTPISAMESIKNLVTNEAKTNMSSAMKSAIRGTVSDNYDLKIGDWDAFDFVYNTVMSGADSMAMASFGNVGGVVLGLDAAGQATNEALKRGLSNDEALKTGFMAGAFEAIFESLSIGQFNAFKDAPVDGIQEALKNLGKTMFVNASEEALTEVANITFDRIANADLSQYETDIRKYIASGMSESEAKKKVALEATGQVIEAAGSGGLMGVGFGTVANVSAYNKVNSTGQDIKSAEQVGNVFEMASMSPEESQAYEAYTRYANKGITAENATNAQVGSLYNMVNSKVKGEFLPDYYDMESSKQTIAEQKRIRENEATSEEDKNKATQKLDEAISDYTDAQKRMSKNLGYAKVAHKLLEIDKKVSNSKYMAEKKAEAKKISADVETSVMAESNEAVDFKGVKFDGKDTKIITNDGEVSIKDVKLSKIDAELITIAKDMDANVASAFVSAYDRSSNVDIDQYLNDFNLVAGYAVNERYTPDYILQHKGSLSAKQVTSIYENTVIAEARKKEAEFNKLISTTASNTPYKGIIDDSIFKNGTVNYNRLDKRQKKAVECLKVFAAKSGMNLTFTPESKYYNGYFDRETNTIYVSVGAGIVRDKGLLKDTIIPTASHEITHWMEEKSPELWEKLKNVALDTLAVAKNQKQEDIIASEVERLNAKHPGKKHTADDAVREIVARCCEDMLSMSEEGKKMFDTMSEAEQKTFKEKVMEIINNLKEWINEFLSSYGTQTEEAKLLRNYKDKLEEMSKIWDEMLVRSIEVNQALEKAGTFKDIDGKPIDPERISSNELDIEYSLKYNGDIAKGQLEYLEKNKAHISEAELKEAQKVTAAMVDVMMKYSSILPEDKIGKVLTKNGSYDRSVENTTICVRTLAYNEFIDKVQEEIGRPLTQMESFLVSQKLYDIATEPQCLYCYVSLDRKAFNEMLLRYMHDRDTVIAKYNNSDKTPEAVSKLYEEFINGRKDTKDMKSRFDKWIGYVDNGTQLLSLADIATEDRQSVIKAEGGILAEQLADARKYAQNASWSKIQKSYVAYRDEILKLGGTVVKNLNEHYGLRWYSFSDYSAAFIVENMQQITDASIRGLKGLAYTKDTDFVEIFAPSGMNINVSVFVNQDANGNFYIDEKQSANFEKALKLRAKYPNVGIVATVTNDAALKWAGDQEWSDVIIPFHIVRTGTDVAEYYKWLNYTSESGDTIKDKDIWNAYVDSLNLKSENSRKKVSKNIYPSEHKNDKSTYLALCESRGLNPRFVRFAGESWYMKLVNETRLSADNSSVLKPNYNFEAAEASFKKFVDKGGYEGGWYKEGVEVDKEAKVVANDVLSGKKANEVDYGRQDGFNPEELVANRKNKRTHSNELAVDDGFQFSDKETKNDALKEDRIYSYNEIVSKGDLKGFVIENEKQVKLTSDGSIDKAWVISEVRKKCKAITTKSNRPAYYTEAPDIGKNVEIVRDGITHGFIKHRKKDDKKISEKALLNARMSLEIPQILKNSIEVNVSVRGNNVDVPYSHIMMGTVALENKDGNIEYYAVRSVIEERKNQNPILAEAKIYGKLHGVNAKKIGEPPARGIEDDVALTGSSAYVYNIAQFLEDVKSVFDDTFSKDVYSKLGMERKEGDFSDYLQFSDKDNSSVYDVMGETERLRAENEQLRKDFADLQERLDLEKQLTHGNYFNENSLGTVAGHLRKISNSSYDKVSLIGRLKEVYSYIAHSENVTWDEMFDMSYRIAEDMLKESKPDVVVNREYKRILSDIRNTKISLDDTQISEAKYRFGNHYNRAFFNKVHLTSEGISLDTMWQDWAERYPDFFDASVSSGNQIGELYDIIESLQEASEIVEEYDMEEQARWLATEIYNQYWNVSTIKTTADKYDRKIKLLNYQHRNRMNALRESYNARLEKQKLASEIHYGKLYNKRIRKIYNKLREQKEAEVAHARELGKQRMVEYKESIERKTVMQSMMGTVMSLNKKLTTNSKDVHIPEDLKPVVINLLNAIDFSSKQLLEMDGTKKSKRGTPTKTDLATENALSKVHSLGSEEASVSSLKMAVMDALELFEKAEKVLSEASDGTVDSSVVTLDVDMIDSIKKMIKELDILEKEIEGRFTLQAMRTDQLKTLNRMVKSINHWAIVADKALANKHKERISDLALQTINENNVYGERQEYIKAIEDVKNFLNWSNVLPVNAFKRLGGAATRFFDSLRDSQDKLTFNRQEIMDFTDALFKGHKIKEWRTDVKEFTIKLPNGKDENGKDKTVEKTVRMPISYIMSLYCVSKQEDAKRHLLGLDSNGNRLTYEGEDKKIHDGGGITISGFKDGKLKVSKNLENTIISEDIIKQITSVLTNEQKDIADKLQEYMNSKGSEWGNAVSEVLYGIKKFDVENYFPITVSPHTVHSDQTKDKRSASFFSIINYGFSKERNPNAKQSIEISDIFDVFANHMNMVAIYNAYALSMFDIARWHNFKGKGADKEELSVTKSIEKAFGKGATTYLSNLIKDLNGQHESSRLSFISALFKNAKVAMVGNSFSVTLLQPTAYFRAMTSIPPKYLLKAALHVKDFGAKNGVAKAKKYCGIALLKSQGYFETGVSANTTTKMLHDESFREKAIEVSLKGAEWMDERTWGLLWNACEFEIRAERKDLKVGSKEFFEVVGEKLRDVIYETQVVDSPLTKSDIMRSPDMGAKSVTMFASEMTVSYNMVLETVYDTVLDYKKNGKEGIVKRNGKRIVMVLTAQALTSAANAIATTAVQALRDDDDEEKDIEAYLSAFLSNFASDILIVGKIPYLKDTISFYQGFSSSRPESLWLESAFKAYRYIDKLVKGEANEDTLRRAIDELLKTGSYFSGYAAYNAWRELRAILNKIGIL